MAVKKRARLSRIRKELEDTPAPPAPPKRTARLEANPPRGTRGRFLRISITMPVEIVAVLKTEGLSRKARGEIDTSISCLIREACVKVYGNDATS